MAALDRFIALAPGQGAYAPDWAIGQPALRDIVERVAATVDEVIVPAGLAPVTSILCADAPPPLSRLLAEQPDELQFAIYTLTVASGQVLEDHRRPDLFVGHSLGEIAALQLAGAFDVATGARIIVARIQALRSAAPPDCGMLAVSATTGWVRSALGLLPLQVELAVVNGETQQVVSGTTADLTRFAELAGAARVSTTRLASPYGFHHSTLAPAGAAFAAALRDLPLGSPHTPVYSPILRRLYRAGDDLGARLAQHLTTPVDFAGALASLDAAGYDTFVELAAGGTLTKLVKRTLRGAYAISLIDPSGELTTDGVLAGLAVATDAPSPATTSAAQAAPPVAAPVEAVSPAPPAAPAPASAPVPAPTVQPAPSGGLDRSAVQERVRTIYAAALEYPAEVFTDDVELEADLGVDSVKQTELIGRLREEFAMPAPPDDFRMASVARFGQVVDLVTSSAEPPGTTADAPAPAPVTAAAPQPTEVDRSAVQERVRTIYAAALEYPAEVFTDDVELEADLGVDSVKQTELIGRLREEFAMPAPPDDFRMASVARFGQVVDLVTGSANLTAV